MRDHEIYDNTPSSYLDDIADIGEKHIRLSYPNFILLLARLDTDYNYAAVPGAVPVRQTLGG